MFVHPVSLISNWKFFSQVFNAQGNAQVNILDIHLKLKSLIQNSLH